MAEEMKLEEVEATFETPENNEEETQISEQESKGIAHKIKTGLKIAGAAIGTAVVVKIARPAIESFVDDIREIKDPNRKTAKQKNLEKKLKKEQEKEKKRHEKVAELEKKLQEFEKNPAENPNPDKQDDNPNPEPTPEENK